MSTLTTVLVVVGILVVIAVGMYFWQRNSAQPVTAIPPPPPPPPANQVQGETIELATVIMDPQNNSRERGTVTISDENGKAKVIFNLVGAPPDTPQPAHIHLGSCTSIGAVAYPLTTVVNGKSETILSLSLLELLNALPLAINVHKSESQAGTYVSCGTIERPTPKG